MRAWPPAPPIISKYRDLKVFSLQELFVRYLRLALPPLVVSSHLFRSDFLIAAFTQYGRFILCATRPTSSGIA